MRHLPVTVFASIRLRRTQRVAPRLTVNGRRGVLEAGCVRHVAYDVVGEQFERVRGAVGEALGEPREKLVKLTLPMSVAPCTQDAHRIVARPKRTTRHRIPV